MSALVRCPQCDTFVKPASLDTGSCPFCPSPQARNTRNPLPGLVLAATMAAVPACSRSPTPSEVEAPVSDITAEDAGKKEAPAIDASVPDTRDKPVYGMAPDVPAPPKLE
ncbi:MAG: hypothetical protein JKY56_08850 [Kofleriaceae bacterium]|nr:hypothetical protein [Kofleriaceae bacterium]